MTKLCIVCGDRGKPGGCPQCHKDSDKIQSIATHGDPLNILDLDLIPNPYQHKVWVAGNSPFECKLQRIHNIFMDGSYPAYSFFLSAKPLYNKLLFAYSCMQAALARGLRVAPLLSTSDISRLMMTARKNPYYKLFNEYTYDDILYSSILFLTVSHFDNHYDDLLIMREILDVRARANKPTYFISDYPLESLVPSWGSDAYNNLYNVDPDCDRLRYPIIIQQERGNL